MPIGSPRALRGLQERYQMDFVAFRRVIFESIDMRSRINIIEKCNLLHSILNAGEKNADMVLCVVQIFLAVLRYYNLDPSKANRNFAKDTLFEGHLTCRDQNMEDESFTLPGLAYIRKRLLTADHWTLEQDDGNGRMVVNCVDLWGVLLAVYRQVIGFTGDTWLDGNSSYTSLKGEIQQYVGRCWRILKMID